MSTPMDGPGLSAAGSVRLWWVTALANLTRPSAAELLSGTELSLALYDFTPTQEQPRETYQLWLGGTVDHFQPPRHTISDVEYDYDPQLLTDPAYPYGLLTPGAAGWLVERRGLPLSTAPAAGQLVDVYPATLGARARIPVDPSVDGEMLRCRQPVAIRGAVLQEVQLL